MIAIHHSLVSPMLFSYLLPTDQEKLIKEVSGKSISR